MSRKGSHPARLILPDPKHGSQLIARFINMVMKSGKKSVAESIVYGALKHIGEKNAEPVALVEKALNNIAPAVEVKSRRVGGATYQVPVEIRGDRRTALAMRWLIRAARARNGRSMVEKLAAEFRDAANGVGATVKRKEDTHKMAESNKAYAHYRW